MKVYKAYRKLEDFIEVNIFGINEKKVYNMVDPVIEVDPIPLKKTLRSLPCDMNIFLPYNDGEDFIIEMFGITVLERGNLQPSDAEGRLLSEFSPDFNEILHDILYEVYKTHKTKKMRIQYYENDKLMRFSDVNVLYDSEKVILVSDLKKTIESESPEIENDDKANFIEYFTQTGSYYRINDKYSWTQGIYNIISRPRNSNDEYYNIIFDLVIPEDRPIVDNMLKVLDERTPKYDTVIRIKTHDGTVKYLDLSLYSKFHENGELRSRYGLIKDITKNSNKERIRPIDFLLNGFKNSKKLALLIDPLDEITLICLLHLQHPVELLQNEFFPALFPAPGKNCR